MMYGETYSEPKEYPEDIIERLEGEEEEEELVSRLNQLSLNICKIRSEAISARQQCGIEDEWLEDEEYYEGIDNVNRGEHRAWRSKPMGQLSLPAGEPTTTSTIFLNITRPYTDAISSKISDMLNPTDDPSWSADATPIPGLTTLADGEITPEIRSRLEQAYPNNPEAQQQEAEVIISQAVEMSEEYKKKAENAEKQIEDWLVECQFHATSREIIDDAAKVGSGIIKGPVPEKKRAVMYQEGSLTIVNEIKPSSRRIDYWNLYPDLGCGESIHDGGYCFERDDIAKRNLRDLLHAEELGYITSQIRQVLREGPFKVGVKAPEHQGALGEGLERDTKNLFEIWYYYGELTRADLSLCGCKEFGDEDLDEDGDDDVFSSLVVMVNNRIIKASVNPLDTGEFPYDIMCLQKRKGLPWGIGVARQIRTAQDIVKGACRMMMDNAGRAGGPQLVVKQGILESASGNNEIVPWGVWLASEDADLEHLDNAFRFITIPMLQGELEQIIHLGLKLAEDTTGLPALMQGHVGSAPDTLGGMQMMTNNSSSVLRRVAKLYDDRVTEPHIRRYYVYLLQYGDDEAKGDFQIDARGSSALVEREIQSQNIAQLGNMTLNPIFGVDPKKWMQEYLKSQRLDPKKFDYDDEEWRQIVQTMMQPQEETDSSVQVATIRAEVEQMKLAQSAQQKEAELTVQVLEAEKDRSLDMAIEYMKREIEAMRGDKKSEVSLDQIDGKLTEAAMKLRAQLKLAGDNRALKAAQVTTPAFEPPGRAPDGEAFQK